MSRVENLVIKQDGKGEQVGANQVGWNSKKKVPNKRVGLKIS